MAILDQLLQLRLVQYLMLLWIVVLLVLAGWLGVRTKFLAESLKKTKADLAWVQGALSLQNEGVQRAAEETKKLQALKQLKAQEASKAKATAAERAAEILRLRMSKDCKEVTLWGIERGALQSRW